jgi:N-acetylmuramoyl-L-alanine amidase
MSYNSLVLNLNPGPINIPLKHFRDKKHFSSQTAAINEIVRREKLEGNSVISLNIHANAAGVGWNDKREGAVIFVRNKPSQDEIRLARCLKKRFDTIEHYVEPTRVLHKNFTMVHKVKCPAVLVECGFMTDREDAKYMQSERGRWEIARAIYLAIGDFRHAQKNN